MKILGIDPSGNFTEGKGTTGLCLLNDDVIVELEEVKAEKFSSVEEYWLEIKEWILSFYPDFVVMEGYRLYNHAGMAAETQANSTLETPQLIGVIRLLCHEFNIPLHIQYASEVKSRWSDKILQRKEYLDRKNKWNGKSTNAHKRDALRHALHFRRYKQ